MQRCCNAATCFQCYAARSNELRLISSPVNAAVKTGSASGQHVFPHMSCDSNSWLTAMAFCNMRFGVYVATYIYTYGNIYIYIYMRPICVAKISLGARFKNQQVDRLYVEVRQGHRCHNVTVGLPMVVYGLR